MDRLGESGRRPQRRRRARGAVSRVQDIYTEVTNVDGRWFDDEAIVLEPLGRSAKARMTGFALMLPATLMLLAAMRRRPANDKPLSF